MAMLVSIALAPWLRVGPLLSAASEHRSRAQPTGSDGLAARNNQQDPYSVLGIPYSASASLIKSSFKRKALLHHPDRNLHDPETARLKFLQVCEAYEKLTDGSHSDFRAQPQPQKANTVETVVKYGWAPGSTQTASVNGVEVSFVVPSSAKPGTKINLEVNGVNFNSSATARSSAPKPTASRPSPSSTSTYVPAANRQHDALKLWRRTPMYALPGHLRLAPRTPIERLTTIRGKIGLQRAPSIGFPPTSARKGSTPALQLSLARGLVRTSTMTGLR